MYGLIRQPLTAGFCEATASLRFDSLLFLLTPFASTPAGGSGCIRVFGFAVGISRAIIPARLLACRRSFAGSRHAARKPCSPARRGQTFKRPRRPEWWPAIHGGHPPGHRCAMSKTAPGGFLLSAWSSRVPTRLHELRLATSTGLER